MPLPLILGIGAGIAGAAGLGAGVNGAVKMKKANDIMKDAEARHNQNIRKFENRSKLANAAMDKLGELELRILKDFDDFSKTIEKIQNKPDFEEYNKDGVKLPKYNKEELTKVSVGAGVLLGGLGGAAIGTAGGFAAAGATTSAVMALGTASTGTAIASLSGAAATNATLAALGGGAIAAGGGGIALGTTILGATTLGVGVLVGGIIFNLTGKKLSNKADEAYYQMKSAEDTINKICRYLTDLESLAKSYSSALVTVREKYNDNYKFISYVVNKMNKYDWNEFSDDEKLALENTVLLVGLLYKMCQVNLVIKAKNENEMNTLNRTVVNKTLDGAEKILEEIEGSDFDGFDDENLDESVFKMTIEDCFSITGKGIVITGTVEFGKIKIGDRAVIKRTMGSNRIVAVSGIEKERMQCESAKEGDFVGILLRGIFKGDVGSGDILMIGEEN